MGFALFQPRLTRLIGSREPGWLSYLGKNSLRTANQIDCVLSKVRTHSMEKDEQFVLAWSIRYD